MGHAEPAPLPGERRGRGDIRFMSDERRCGHGPGYVCGLCMEPTEEEQPCHDDPGDCDYDCPRFARSHAGF